MSAPLNTLQDGVCVNSHQRCDGINGWVDDYSRIPDYEEIEISCDDNLDNDCDGDVDGSDLSCSLNDHILPTINSFSVNENSGKAEIDWSVSDAGGSHLKKVEIWRATDNNGSVGTWLSHPIYTVSIPGTEDTFISSYSDNPGSGTWWYNLYVKDQFGNITSNNASVSVTIPPICLSNGLCDGVCPDTCTLNEDPDCGCQDNNFCCGINCTNSNDNNCASSCGNGFCESGEDCVNCSVDCGLCADPCGDGICNEDCSECSLCPQDCFCGDNHCGCGEDASTCPTDCQ